MLKFVYTFLLMLGAAWGPVAHAESVLFLNPGKTDEAFWISYSQFMQAAAKDLRIDLRILYSQRMPELTVAQARLALQGPDRPDYLVFVNEQYVAPQILRLAQGSGVKLFTVNASLTANQLSLLGERSDRLGSLVPNDEEGGYLMLKELIRQHPPVAPGQVIELLAFSGLKITPSSQLREQGMLRALAEHPQVRLRQVVYGGWSRGRAYEQAKLLFRRYPNVSLVWSANDEMAFGAMQAYSETGGVPGKDALFSGVNTSPAALQAMIDGRLSVLVGGHFTLGGWALVELHDVEMGVDLDQYGGRDRLIPVLQLIDKAHAKRLLAMGASPDYGVNFRRLSAKGRPTSYRYPFSLQTLMR
ncbi:MULTISPECIES: ABC transporter substrate-binding protein [Pseudomonas]|jgi:ABC-type sugar transport system substrate-binding protein|uniref:Periplasmic binding protein domain-containing protein n=1 Tax=Pseudomonas fluorescens TaxID=294 RepID=A0A5E7IVZ0_PSEFL|nr:MULTISPECIES: ABC transporter substrate-binding protein [Pseudomonas]MDO9329659.1 ABC transporter substrate-binding protein [Pseudomonas sp.]QKG65328.1 ABC transporter substrate-binding protein [Pseudomonas sp. B14-6]TWC13507.1 monosaccharide ABC transporter substrate-binding protein (CUT2 family) [Pseudomonas sp. SJZ083]TWC42819.1 monosaccharide ABC transporter substrate-binding protein (CUT2 family) [Pseudomonas sp. SJZ077]WNF53118.1 ABC transporter substrate-binding protein [Pseudomonas 